MANLSNLGVKLSTKGGRLRISAPKGVLTPALRDQLAHARQEILTLLMTGQDFPTADPPLVPTPHAGPRPLSFAQQRLWFLDQMQPGTSVCVIPVAKRLVGPLDVDVLQDALSEVVRRHEILRATFTVIEGRPVQVVSAPSRLPLPVIDLQHVPEAEREAEATAHAREEAGKIFDLARGPLFRAVLLRLRPEEHLLVITMHHLVSDGWSLGVLARELGTLYPTLLAGRPSPLPELPVQYADFASWQRTWLTGDRLQSQLDYWRGRLLPVPAVLALPTDRPRPPVQSFRGAGHAFRLSTALTGHLSRLSRREGVTLFMTLLAAFKALLARYTGSHDIVVGTPIANRVRVELEGLVGFFANTLVLRTDLSGKPTFRELVRRVRDVALGAFEHQDVPFEKLVEELHPERTLGHNPLFQVTFVLQNAPHTREFDVVASTGSMFDLTVFMSVDGDGLSGTIEYKADLFDAPSIARMAEHFRILLEGMVEDPDRALEELPMLTAAERHQLLVEWNDTATAYPRDHCIHHLFAEQAYRTPDAVALVLGDETVTYGELDRRAEEIADHLRRWSVGPDVPVGVWMERSIELIVVLLGILKAGGAYVPLDLATPRERLAFILEDAGIRVLLTQKRRRRDLPDGAARIVCVDEPWVSPPGDAVVRRGSRRPQALRTSCTRRAPAGSPRA